MAPQSYQVNRYFHTKDKTKFKMTGKLFNPCLLTVSISSLANPKCMDRSMKNTTWVDVFVPLIHNLKRGVYKFHFPPNLELLNPQTQVDFFLKTWRADFLKKQLLLYHCQPCLNYEVYIIWQEILLIRCSAPVLSVTCAVQPSFRVLKMEEG